MKNRALLGYWRFMIPIPARFWQGRISGTARKTSSGIARLSEEYHQVRDFVVREMHRADEPLSPAFIGQQLNLPAHQVNTILDDLEKRLFFLFRNEQGAVTWAYPATADTTPHHLTYSTGEQGYAA